MESFNVNYKKITIFNDKYTKKLPLVILNTFDEDGIKILDECKKLNTKDFIFACISNIDWDKDMSLWKTEEIKGSNNGAENYLNELVNIIIPKIKEKVSFNKIFITRIFNGRAFFNLFII